ncbi:type I glyceraldehyde-3-phosphate dehydrogenase [Candidatus Uhrbacteria bacterium]|nr:type I glyceraldehyde-3-phosphate dehydrogenase [Candidatus Uhrbacteria bacterium]
MPVRVAINGFGRIGRNTLKAAWGRLKGFEVVAVNDLTDTKTLAHLLKYDTVYGQWGHRIGSDPRNLIIDGKKIPVFAVRNPAELPWGKMKVDVVLECTGIFRDREKAGLHLQAGAKLVVISAPGKGKGIPTSVLGVNVDAKRDNFGKARIINNASCTTNCIAPVAKVIDRKFGVRSAFMTTIHGYTADQNLQDGPHKDLRRARAAAVNIVPTTTGAAVATGEAIPSLQGKFDGLAIRVPVPVVSLADLTFVLKRKTDLETVRRVLREAAAGDLKGIMSVTEEPLVSSDFVGHDSSSVVDLDLTMLMHGNLLKVIAWYDNEWGYSMRLAEMAVRFAKSQLKKRIA